MQHVDVTEEYLRPYFRLSCLGKLTKEVIFMLLVPECPEVANGKDWQRE